MLHSPQFIYYNSFVNLGFQSYLFYHFHDFIIMLQIEKEIYISDTRGGVSFKGREFVSQVINEDPSKLVKCISRCTLRLPSSTRTQRGAGRLLQRYVTSLISSNIFTPSSIDLNTSDYVKCVQFLYIVNRKNLVMNTLQVILMRALIQHKNEIKHVYLYYI